MLYFVYRDQGLAPEDFNREDARPNRRCQQRREMNSKIELWCAWSGLALTALFFCMMVPTNLVPVLSPSTSPEQVAALLNDNVNAIRIGMLLAMIGSAFLFTWGVGLAYQLERTAQPHPLLTYLQIAASAIATMVGTVLATVGSIAVFRPDTVSLEITQLLHDLLWFCYLITWPPFTIWAIVIGVAVLSSKQHQPAFPRWSGYLSLWAAVLMMPAGLCLFFKSGPFSYNGVIVWWIPTLAFFGWIVVMSALMIRVAYRQVETSSPAASISG